MIWLTFRQARRELLIILTLYVLMIGFFLITGSGIHAEVARATMLHCAAPLPINFAACGKLNLLTNWGWLLGLTPWIQTLPVLFGFLVGVPVIAQEAEQGTLQLSWTQSVTRRRWLGTKIALLSGLVLIMAAGIQGLMHWWDAPFMGSFSLLTQPLYDFAGTVPYALALGGLALGFSAGAVLRRSVLAVAVTLGSYLALWLGSDAWLRFHLIPSLVAYTTTPDVLPSGQHVFLLDQGWVDAHHHLLETNVVFTTCLNSSDFTQCVHDHGWLFFARYIPDSYEWLMQGAESMVIFGMSVICVGLACWRVFRLRL